MPVSETEKAQTEPSCSAETRRATDPFSVNLKALDSRFFRICWTRCSSVGIVSGSQVSTSTEKFSSCWLAMGRKVCSRSRHRALRRTGRMAMSIFPASTLERSRMSLISASRS